MRSLIFQKRKPRHREISNLQCHGVSAEPGLEPRHSDSKPCASDYPTTCTSCKQPRHGTRSPVPGPGHCLPGAVSAWALLQHGFSSGWPTTSTGGGRGGRCKSTHSIELSWSRAGPGLGPGFTGTWRTCHGPLRADVWFSSQVSTLLLCLWGSLTPPLFHLMRALVLN